MALEVPDFERLFAKLNNTKLQNTNPPLWEFLRELVQRLVIFAKSAAGNVNALATAFEGFRLRTYVTTADESAFFPFSRKMEAGIGISFDDSISNVRTINSTGGGDSSRYDCPLTDGHVDETNLIFANGECIIVQVPNGY